MVLLSLLQNMHSNACQPAGLSHLYLQTFLLRDSLGQFWTGLSLSNSEFFGLVFLLMCILVPGPPPWPLIVAYHGHIALYVFFECIAHVFPWLFSVAFKLLTCRPASERFCWYQFRKFTFILYLLMCACIISSSVALARPAVPQFPVAYLVSFPLSKMESLTLHLSGPSCLTGNFSDLLFLSFSHSRIILF